MKKDIKTTYLVSGFMRTGTSMMMKALEKGGLETVSKDREYLNKQFGDEHYQPNPGGFYELHRDDYQKHDFPKEFEGKLIKCLHGGINKLIVGKYKIVFMKRNQEEIRQSYQSFFGKNNFQLPDNFEERIDIVIDMLKNRKDVNLTILNYRDVIENPENEFQKLKDADWNIDVKKACSVVDKDMYRFKIEDLDVGVT